MPAHHEKVSSEQRKTWHSQVIRTPFCATAVTFSPSVSNLIAVGTAQNFGIAGKGCQYVYSTSPVEDPILRCSFLCNQAVLDCAWSEASPSVLGAALGDGSVALWDVRSQKGQPIVILSGHTRECCSLEWNIQMTQLLLTSSWDLTARLWDVSTGQELLCLNGVHRQAVYAASWCPSQPTIFATCGGDGYMRLLDFRQKQSKSFTNTGPSHFHARSLGNQLCHEGEALSLDWNKFSPFTIATSGTDNVIRLWDIRKLQSEQQSPYSSCLACLLGHALAVRRVQWSPFRETILASGSYDMSVGVWDSQSMVFKYSHHSEFVIDINWSLFTDSCLASASWDGSVVLWDGFGGAQTSQRSSPSKLHSP